MDGFDGFFVVDNFVVLGNEIGNVFGECVNVVYGIVNIVFVF